MRSHRNGSTLVWALLIATVVSGLAVAGPGLRTCSADEETAAKLYTNVNGCVVALENIEGSGTGFVIDKSGLILTNAHVVASPLPFKCTVDVKHGNKTETVVFKKVKVIGLHPERDLALVRIDPKEHNATLQVAKMTKVRPTPGQRVYAIGNPAGGGGMILNKTITSGMISGVGRIIEKVPYYQIDATINPGNSGGPLFNANGEVIGVVTLKFTDVENTGFATPIADFDTRQFKPMKERQGDPQRARELLVEANKLFDKAKQIEKRSPDSEQAKMYYYFSVRQYHEALTADPTNDATYYNVGMLLRTLGKKEIASAYLMQAVELNPWENNRQPGNGLYYHELGLSLAGDDGKNQERVVWEEGVAKYPAQSGKLYEDLAIFHAKANNPYLAAYNAQVALHINSPDIRRPDLTRIAQQMQDRLKPEQRKKLDAEIAQLPKELKRRQDAADRQRQSKKEYLTATFAKFMENQGHLDSKNDSPPPQVAVTDAAAAHEKPAGTEGTTPEKPAAEPPKKHKLPPGTVDLLSHVSVRQDAVKGTWVEDDNGIVSPGVAYARLKVPGKIPAEYDLLVMAERQTNKGELAVGFVRDGRQSVFYLDTERASVSGLDPASRDSYQKPVFTNGKAATIVLKVRREGLLVMVDGERIFFANSADPFPAVPDEWSVRDETQLFLGTNTSKYRVYQMALRPYERP